ncbi:Peptidase family M23 [Nonlabens sp. Hel1_33_55]|uniref:peptidoglycan DD-metalloendopeptidase family protein n=1 Tax=Nonlabens sp. Hel1_33_55 TaxID=1336802 RepID=UPI000875E9A6|nr:peptidoglycan DD-metalloendopeptidase family protein [Nonlabens sp. Hel1_33_55]SCY28585.1 Peptidase family M23 [Nonlabens sp. Hel1_33_55]
MNKLIALVTACICLLSCTQDNQNVELAIATPIKIVPKILYGYDLNNYTVIEDTVQSGDTFNDLIASHLVQGQSAYEAAMTMDSIYELRKIQAGKPFKILKRKDVANTPAAFIYEPNREDFIILKLTDGMSAFKDAHPVTIKRKTATGVVNSTLSEAMEEEGLGMSAIWELSDIYKWTIDFFKLQQGDRFKMIYQERFINDTIYDGIEKIDVAIFETRGKPYYAFDYVTDSIKGVHDYYDDEGKTLRNFFLKAPVNYTRISSRYSGNRFHPVQKRWKAHLGTDYAAGYGTPIVSTANGVVTKSGYTRGNGNYVKVRHNATYETQYLHMTKRLVKVGQRVDQGQTIGTVGSTGLATGPHVCYRFWVNGKQVDPYGQKLPSADPLPKDQMGMYQDYIAPLKTEIDNLPYKEESVL